MSQLFTKLEMSAITMSGSCCNFNYRIIIFFSSLELNNLKSLYLVTSFVVICKVR